MKRRYGILYTMLLVALFALLAADARAERSITEQGEAEGEQEIRNFANLRGGMNTFNPVNRPEVCLDVAPTSVFSLESCGTGNGIWHNDPSPQLTHFRGKMRLGAYKAKPFLFQTYGHLGFAELQEGVDDPGFQFFSAGDRRVETAGPELGLSGRALYPISGAGELIAELSMSVAYLPHAGEMVTPRARTQPSLSLTLGVGF